VDEKELFDRIAESIKSDHPSFEIRFKNESSLMRALDLLVFPFNDRFMDGYTTTIGSKVYLPSETSLKEDYRGYARVLAHEGVHIFDSEESWFFKISYLLFEAMCVPLVAVFAFLGSWVPIASLLAGLVLAYSAMALVRSPRRERELWRYESKNLWARRLFYLIASLSVVSYLVLAVWLSGWWAALAVGAFIPLVPFRSPWRARWEYRGYAMGMAISFWKYGVIRDSSLRRISDTFTGPHYYFMDPNRDRVMSRLHMVKLSVLDHSILEGKGARPFQRTLEVYRSLGMSSW
jgi:hypothetical protein